MKLIQWLNKVNGGHEFRKHETFVLTVLSFIEIDPELVKSFTFAAWTGDVSKIGDMMESGMPVDILDEYGNTALMNAARNNRTDVVRYLLANGANVNKQDRSGNTALHKASNNNHTDVVRCLLANGANVDKQNRSGWTALHEASLYNKTDLIIVLLQHGASRDIKDKYGRTPIDYARGKNHKEAVDLLEQYGEHFLQINQSLAHVSCCIPRVEININNISK